MKKTLSLIFFMTFAFSAFAQTSKNQIYKGKYFR